MVSVLLGAIIACLVLICVRGDHELVISDKAERITSRIVVDNSANSQPVDSFLFAFDDSKRRALAYVSASIDKKTVPVTKVDAKVWRLSLSGANAISAGVSVSPTIEIDAYFSDLLTPFTETSLPEDPTKTQTPKPKPPVAGSADSYNDWSCEQLDFCSDRLGFEAIKWLHNQLDDDANGNVDITESVEFIRDELQYENDYARQKAFHGNDKHITVDELWKTWKTSEVRNWTVDETVEWLVNSVELPQYSDIFHANAVDGMALPRLAVNTQIFNILGINNPIHKQKIALKAMDVVLFGAQKHHNYVKDGLLMFSLLIAIIGCWFAYVQHTYSQSHLKKMIRDMDSLQRAEEQLMELQQELDKTRQEQQNVVMEKFNLEKRLKENERHFDRSDSFACLTDASKISELEDELRRTREDLRRAETAVASRAWVPPQQLQQWLQLTHELEIKHYNSKKASAELQLHAAKEGCDKLRKKRLTLIKAFRVAHGNSIDDVDNKISIAKTTLSELTNDLKERLNRWKQIETYCGFSVVHNPGLLYLESVLYSNIQNDSPKTSGLTTPT